MSADSRSERCSPYRRAECGPAAPETDRDGRRRPVRLLGARFGSRCTRRWAAVAATRLSEDAMRRRSCGFRTMWAAPLAAVLAGGLLAGCSSGPGARGAARGHLPRQRGPVHPHSGGGQAATSGAYIFAAFADDTGHPRCFCRSPDNVADPAFGDTGSRTPR